MKAEWLYQSQKGHIPWEIHGGKSALLLLWNIASNEGSGKRQDPHSSLLDTWMVCVIPLMVRCSSVWNPEHHSKDKRSLLFRHMGGIFVHWLEWGLPLRKRSTDFLLHSVMTSVANHLERVLYFEALIYFTQKDQVEIDNDFLCYNNPLELKSGAAYFKGFVLPASLCTRKNSKLTQNTLGLTHIATVWSFACASIMPLATIWMEWIQFVVEGRVCLDGAPLILSAMWHVHLFAQINPVKWLNRKQNLKSPIFKHIIVGCTYLFLI